MKKKIVLSPDFFIELEELLEALVEGDYFSSYEWAFPYINSIEQFVEESVGTYPPKPMPSALEYSGSLYIPYRYSQHTTWYIIYDETDEEYPVRHITNNHVSGQYFNI